MKKIIKVFAWIIFIGSAWEAVGWYIEWLDQYFLWRFFASLIGFITAPLFPIAVMIEWFWHQWPNSIGLSFTMIIISYLILTIIYKNE